MGKDYLQILMRAPNTLFTTSEVTLLWQESDVNFIKKKLYRYIKTSKLYSVKRGIYAKDKTYDKFELATKIYTPAYISFETVLARAGVIFQFYGQIFVASYINREIIVNNQTYSFKKIKKEILTNTLGIEMKNNYYIASPERAFLDVIYLNTEYYFDNLASLDWKKIDTILPIYGGNKRMARKIKKYRAAAEAEKELN